MADFTGSAEANSAFAEAQNALGLFLVGLGRMESAIEAFHRAIKLDATFSGALINLADLYRLRGQDPDSERVYAEPVAATPDEAVLRYGHAPALLGTALGSAESGR